MKVDKFGISCGAAFKVEKQNLKNDQDLVQKGPVKRY